MKSTLPHPWNFLEDKETVLKVRADRPVEVEMVARGFVSVSLSE